MMKMMMMMMMMMMKKEKRIMMIMRMRIGMVKRRRTRRLRLRTRIGRRHIQNASCLKGSKIIILSMLFIYIIIMITSYMFF